MILIAGLGNPGIKYNNTRHNVGFEAVECLAARHGIVFTERKFRAYCGSGVIEGQKVLLMKPQTFMNLSGESIAAAVRFYKCNPQEELWVFCDDIHLDVGQLRIRQKGSAGGHNGLKNLILHLGNEQFLRARIGVGAKPPEMDLADFVLGRFSGAEMSDIERGAEAAARAAEVWLRDGADAAMNQFNRRVTAAE